MKKTPELLSPAGSMEALCAAVDGGADAVYFGGTAFNARIFANNFDAAAMREALEELVYHKYLVQGSCGKPMGELCTHTGCIWHPYRAAISAPARNCDRFKTAEVAMEEWGKYPQSRYKGCRVCPHGDASMVSPTHLTLAEWLFAPAVQ